MSRKRSEEKTGLSPIQRKACVVMAFCVLAVVLSFLVSWILPAKLGLFGESDLYDPTQYPLDTSLGSILGQESAQGNYINDTVFVGGTQAVSMSKDSSITLNQYAGKDGLKVSQVLRETCVNFADDANSYTTPQAIAKMKPLHVYVMVGSDDLDGSVSVDEFVNDYKQILQSIKSAYSACDVVACAIAPVSKDAADAAQKQTYIDQYNQQLAVACNDMGFKYLNLPEVMKNDKGYAVDSYVDASTGGFSGSGVNVVLDYIKNHAHNVEDTRGDRGEIPQRAASAAGNGSSATPAPTATPNKLTASYRVENGKGTLTVENGEMTMHVSLQSQKIVNLYLGMAADAPDHEDEWLQPTIDTVTYSDGTSDEVYGFDIPVAAVDTDFQLAILGTKGTWYDHVVSVSNAVPAVDGGDAAAAEVPADGTYTCAVTLEGGSGRATVDSPAALTVVDGAMTATIVWSSPNYDYMLIDGEKYLPTNTEGNSTFEIPVAALDTALAVTADTVAMSTPHEIDYTLTFDSTTLAAAE